MKFLQTLGASVLFALVSAQAAFAGVEINATPNDVMIHGYDPVAYFTAGKPVEGDAKFTKVHAGGIYRFASEKNRDDFAANPAKYAPEFGGFCAYGASVGKKFDGDPTAWKIVENKLYLNLNKDVQRKWLEDTAGFIKVADEQWPEIKDKAADDL